MSLPFSPSLKQGVGIPPVRKCPRHSGCACLQEVLLNDVMLKDPEDDDTFVFGLGFRV